MTGSDWAGEQTTKMEREFGEYSGRYLRITGLVRRMLSDPHFESLREHEDFDEQVFSETFRGDLTESLKQQDGDTVEESWNQLVRKQGWHKIAGVDLHIDPWLGDRERHRTQDNFADNSVFETTRGHQLTKDEVSEMAWGTDREVIRVRDGFLIGNRPYIVVDGGYLERSNPPLEEVVSEARRAESIRLDSLDSSWREEDDEGDRNDIERARKLFKTAVDEPDSVDKDEILELISEPPVQASVYSNAVTALARIAAERDDIGGEFVNPLERFLERPSLKDEVALRALRHVASNDPEKVSGLRDEIIAKIDTEYSPDVTVTRAATGCCVEIANADPDVLIDYTPLFGTLLHSNDETIKRNSVYVLTCIADEHPEEVLPAVQDVVEALEDGDPDGSKTSLLGKVSRHYPDATVDAAPVLEDFIQDDVSSKTKANAVGVFADIAKEYPGEVSEYVESAEALLKHEDATVRHNTCGFFEEVSKGCPEAVKPLVSDLIRRLDDENPSVRLKATYILGELRAEEAAAKLEEVSEEDTWSKTRKMAEMALSRME